METGLILSREKLHFYKSELKYLRYIVNYHSLRSGGDCSSCCHHSTSNECHQTVDNSFALPLVIDALFPNSLTFYLLLQGLLKKCEMGMIPWLPEVLHCIKEAPVMSCTDFNSIFILQTDASSYGLGAGLTQHFDNEEEVIACLSRSYTKSEARDRILGWLP